MSEDKKSPLEQAVDRALNLFFYVPIGLALGAEEVIPQLVERGKQQVAAARMFGKYALEEEAPKALGKLQEQLQDQLGRRPRGRTAPTETAAAPSDAAPSETPTAPASPSSGPGAAALAIPDYDSLSASQVVPRLAGLSGDELEAVREYESGHRGRKTILNRVDQLQTHG